MLGALWLYSLVGGGGPENGSAFLSETSPARDASEGAALPEELSYNANGGVVLIRRDGTRRVLAKATYRHLPNGRWLVRLYNALEWSRDGSKLLALRWGSPRALVVIDARARGSDDRSALDGRWSPDGARLAFMRHEPGLRPGRSSSHRATDATRSASPRTSGRSRGPPTARSSRTSERVPRVSHRRHRAVVGRHDRSRSRRSAGAPPRVRRGSAVVSRRVAHRVHDRQRSVRRSARTALAPPGDGRRIRDRRGRRTAAARCRQRRADVWVVRTDGRGLRRIAHCPCTFRGATGTSAAWSSGRESDRVHQRTRQRRQHDPPGRNRRRLSSHPGR